MSSQCRPIHNKLSNGVLAQYISAACVEINIKPYKSKGQENLPLYVSQCGPRDIFSEKYTHYTLHTLNVYI